MGTRATVDASGDETIEQRHLLADLDGPVVAELARAPAVEQSHSARPAGGRCETRGIESAGFVQRNRERAGRTDRSGQPKVPAVPVTFNWLLGVAPASRAGGSQQHRATPTPSRQVRSQRRTRRQQHTPRWCCPGPTPPTRLHRGDDPPRDRHHRPRPDHRRDPGDRHHRVDHHLHRHRAGPGDRRPTSASTPPRRPAPPPPATSTSAGTTRHGTAPTTCPPPTST